MTIYHDIEAECERLADCPDTAENAKLGITFRAVWWRQIQQEIKNQAAEIERLRAAIQDAIESLDSLYGDSPLVTRLRAALSISSLAKDSEP